MLRSRRKLSLRRRAGRLLMLLGRWWAGLVLVVFIVGG